MGFKDFIKKRFVNGREVGDPTPMELPANYKHPMSLNEMLARVQAESARMQAAGLESLEDAEDFDVDDDFDPSTPWEKEFDMALPEHLHEPLAQRITKKRNEEIIKARNKKADEEEAEKYNTERKKRFWARGKRAPKKADR